MNPLGRGVLSLVAAFVAYLLTFWWLSELLLPASTPKALRMALALAVAVGTAVQAWRALGRVPSGLVATAWKWACLLGAVGFFGGFFGPMVLAPQANQGPLLGIFITGPLGVVLGAVVGAVMWFRQRRGTT